MDWETINQRLNKLLEQNRLSELRGALLMINVVDIAQFMSELAPDKLLTVFRILPKDISADVFAYMPSDQQQVLIQSIGDSEIRSLMDEMFLDDTVDFLEELPASVVKRVLANTDEKTRSLINQFLRYPENSAGSIMTIEFAEFHSSFTVKKAMESLRATGLDKETINTCYVIDDQRHLIGSVALRKLILAQDDTPITEIMDPNVISVHTLDDQEAVADTVRKYDLLSIPVVDNEGRLVGIITADDIMDVIQDEATEDIEKMAALLPSENEYMKTNVFTLAKNRLPWLLFLMISGIFTGLIIQHFEDTLTNMAEIGVMLTACIPMLMGTGGNCGSQSSTLVIRGLAVGEISPADTLKILWKECRVSILVSVVLAAMAMAMQLFLFRRPFSVALTVSLAMIGTVVISKSIGCTLPMLAKKLKLDPALMAAPLITTIVDTCSLLILFLLATAIIKI